MTNRLRAIDRNARRAIELLRDKPDGMSNERIAFRLGVDEEAVPSIVSKARTILRDGDTDEFIPWKPTSGFSNYRITEEMTDDEVYASYRWLRYGLTLVLSGTSMLRTHSRSLARQGEWYKAEGLLDMLEHIEAPVQQLRDYLN